MNALIQFAAEHIAALQTYRGPRGGQCLQPIDRTKLDEILRVLVAHATARVNDELAAEREIVEWLGSPDQSSNADWEYLLMHTDDPDSFRAAVRQRISTATDKPDAAG